MESRMGRMGEKHAQLMKEVKEDAAAETNALRAEAKGLREALARSREANWRAGDWASGWVWRGGRDQ
eukprot:8442861-Pyramimonas_sp.AAC.1